MFLSPLTPALLPSTQLTTSKSTFHGEMPSSKSNSEQEKSCVIRLGKLQLPELSDKSSRVLPDVILKKSEMKLVKQPCQLLKLLEPLLKQLRILPETTQTVLLTKDYRQNSTGTPTIFTVDSIGPSIGCREISQEELNNNKLTSTPLVLNGPLVMLESSPNGDALPLASKTFFINLKDGDIMQPTEMNTADKPAHLQSMLTAQLSELTLRKPQTTSSEYT